MQVSSITSSVNNFQGKKKEKDSNKVGAGTMALGYMGGSLGSTFIGQAYQQTIGNLILSKLSKINPSKEDNMSEVLETSLKTSGLEAKGIKLVDVSNFNSIEIYDSTGKLIDIKTPTRQVKEILLEEYKNHPLTKNSYKNPIMHKYFEKVSDVAGESIAKGKNALYTFDGKILINSEKLGFAGFHEMGHAINKHMSKIGKILQNSRTPLSLLSSSLLALALFTNKRTEENPPENKWQKFTQGVKENIGKISAFATLPMLAEEILASVKGQKLAKTVLPKHLIKSVTKTHALSAMSYMGITLVSGIAAFGANKIRDRIVHGKDC